MAIPVVFDVLGTLFGFDGMVQALQKRFPELTEREAKSLCSDAFHSGQRNFTCKTVRSTAAQPQSLQNTLKAVLTPLAPH